MTLKFNTKMKDAKFERFRSETKKNVWGTFKFSLKPIDYKKYECNKIQSFKNFRTHMLVMVKLFYFYID